MKTGSIQSQALSGIRQAMDSARSHAQQITAAGNGAPASLIEPLVGLQQDSLQVQASARVLRVADELIGSLFDDEA